MSQVRGPSGEWRIERGEVVSLALRRLRPPAGTELLEVRCDSALAIRYRDVLELLLACGPVRRWRWSDRRGRVSPAQPLWFSAAHAARDVVAWPGLVARTSWQVRSASRAISQPAALGRNPACVYLRTDHWFGLAAGGSVGHVRGVVGGLRSLGLAAHVVTTEDLGGLGPDDAVHVVEPRYELGRNIPELPEMLYSEACAGRVAACWREWSPSFVYQRYSLGDTTGVRLRRRFGVPLVCEYNGPLAWVARRWGRRRLLHEGLLQRIERLNVRAADLVVVVSEALRRELLGRGVRDEVILVNPNGVDTSQYSPSVDGGPVRQRYGLGGKVVVGFIGTFGRWHGAEVLADAFARLLREGPEHRERVRLLLVGDGVTMPLVKERLRAGGVEQETVLAGLVPQAEGPRYLAAADILVAPHVPNPDGTPFFGSPTKLFEYMAMGKGIVASDLGQIGEVLAHDGTGCLAPPGDAEALAAGLRLLIEDEPRRRRLGAAALREAQRYTWREHTRRMLERLRERCGGSLPAA